MTGRRVRCTVTAMNYSACGLRLGDHFEVGPEGLSLPAGKHFCYFAISAVTPMLLGRFDQPDTEAWLATRPRLSCPDPPEGLVMTLEAAPGNTVSEEL